MFAVDNPAPMGQGQRLGYPPRQHQSIAEGERAALEARREVLPIEPLHGEKSLPVLRLAVRDIPDNTGVLELGEDLSL